MNADEIIAEVQLLVRDASFSEAQALTDVNSGLALITSLPRLTLPRLAATAVVETVEDDDTATLPANFGHSVYAADLDEVPLDIYDDYPQMRRALADVTGDVLGVAVDADGLRLLPEQSESVDIRIDYYRQATPLVSASGDVSATSPEGFSPLQQVFVDRALIHYAAYLMWSRIEISMDGRKPNTEYHEKKFWEKVDELERSVRAFTTPYPQRNATYQ